MTVTEKQTRQHVKLQSLQLIPSLGPSPREILARTWEYCTRICSLALFAVEKSGEQTKRSLIRRGTERSLSGCTRPTVRVNTG